MHLPEACSTRKTTFKLPDFRSETVFTVGVNARLCNAVVVQYGGLDVSYTFGQPHLFISSLFLCLFHLLLPSPAAHATDETLNQSFERWVMTGIQRGWK